MLSRALDKGISKAFRLKIMLMRNQMKQLWFLLSQNVSLAVVDLKSVQFLS